MCIAIGGSSGQTPSLPAASAAPTMAKAEEANKTIQKTSAKDIAQKKLASTGSTILTSPFGAQNSAKIGKKTLLGV